MEIRVLKYARATIKVGGKTVVGGAGAGGTSGIVSFKAEKTHHVCCDCGYPAKAEDELTVHRWMCTTHSSDRLPASELDRLAALHYLLRGDGESDADFRARIKNHLLESHAQRIR